MERKKYIENRKKEAIALTRKINPAVLSKEIAFTHIKPQDFICSLREIVLEPNKIKQGLHPICGVSAALKIAAELDPVTLVKMAVNFYVNGNYNPGNFLLRQIKVPERVRNTEITSGLSAASFVLQISVKNFLNRFSTYKPVPNNLSQIQGITFPWQIKKFLTDYFRVDSINRSLFKNNFNSIKEKIESGHRLLALTSWKQMNHPNSRISNFDLHYLLIKGIEKKEDQIILYVDDSSGTNSGNKEFIFQNEKELKKAVRAVYTYNKKGFKESELLAQPN
ncbi:MAG: hypothetical protein MK078_00805 [Crocinitomicaceae bacterium]|nr:hypothetical protein [Crocinitomicaceae bacterium]